MLTGGLNRRDRTTPGFRQIKHLTSAPPDRAGSVARNVDMVAKQKQKRLVADKRASTPHGMPIPFRLGLNSKLKPAIQFQQAFGLLFGPRNPTKSRAQHLRVRSKVATINFLITRRSDNTDLFNPTFKRFFRNNLQNGLGETISIYQGQHGFLYRVRSGILPQPTPSRCDDCFGDSQDPLQIYDSKAPGVFERNPDKF
jgi:hypothetical protein